MQFVEIEGPLEELRKLRQMKGVTLPRGALDLGGGRWRVSAYLATDEARAEIERRGLSIRVTMDEDEVRRRVKETEDMMRGAFEREREAEQQKTDDSSDPKKP